VRPFFLLAAIPFALGCAQQSAMRVPALPTDEPLHVRLFRPAGGALNYELSEPAYVAIFAIHRGEGISMIYPHFRSQIDSRSKAGFNQQFIHRLNTSRAYSASAGYEARVLLFGPADAYYVIASKYPLPLEGILGSPWALRSLVGADLFRATDLRDTWYALEELLVEGLPDDAWASDVYLNWRYPLGASAFGPRPLPQYCHDGRSYMAFSFFDTSRCYGNDRKVAVTTVPVTQAKLRRPPKKPFDRDPSVPLPPDQLEIRTSASGSGVTHRARSRGEGASTRSDNSRESDRRRGESVRAADREVSSVRPQPPSPPRAAESRPQRQPSRTQGTKPQPKPEN
jgi:hypothetical protein